MGILDVINVGFNYVHRFAGGHESTSPQFIDYRAIDDVALSCWIRVGFRITQDVYGSDRRRVIVWISYEEASFKNARATAFLGADNFESTGDVLHELNQPGLQTMCRFPEPIPQQYLDALPREAFIEYRSRLDADRVPSSWAIVANIADHERMIKFAAVLK